MLVTEKGQVTLPKPIRAAAGVVPGSQVAFSPEGRRIVITPLASHVRNDRRAQLRAAAAKLSGSLSPEFRPIGAEEIMYFLRGDALTLKKPRRARP